MNQSVLEKIENLLDEKIKSSTPCSGGCISDAYSLETNRGQTYFAKIGSSFPDMFPKEEEGLRELSKAQAIRIPKVLHAEKDFILMEYIVPGQMGVNTHKEFGRSLAKLHKYHGEEFGLDLDNYIGSTPQVNTPSESWQEFYFQNRLLFQFNLAENRGHVDSSLSKNFLLLEKKLSEILGGVFEPPSLLHGDLWSGNYLVDENKSVCLVDPAAYYGNREAEFGMITLFGGFNEDFFSGYQEVYPLAKDWQYRNKIYQLYHLFNHLNIFGQSYLGQVNEAVNYYL